jgi:hypothetical protein
MHHSLIIHIGCYKTDNNTLSLLADSLIASKNADMCARPDCTEEVEEGVCFVSCILGRRTKVQGGLGRKYEWLLKWDG